MCAWADVDRNGKPDAYCTTGRTLQNYVKRDRCNELWLQKRNGTFLQVGRQWRVDDVCGRGRLAAFVDANGDRFPDLFVANSEPRQVADEFDNEPDLPDEDSKLFINQGGTTFRYTPRRMRVSSGVGERCIVPLDFNADGWQDVYLCRSWDQPPVLYQNSVGRGYVDVNSRHQLADPVADTAVVDLDRDGDPDLVTARPGRIFSAE